MRTILSMFGTFTSKMTSPSPPCLPPWSDTIRTIMSTNRLPEHTRQICRRTTIWITQWATNVIGLSSHQEEPKGTTKMCECKWPSQTRSALVGLLLHKVLPSSMQIFVMRNCCGSVDLFKATGKIRVAYVGSDELSGQHKSCIETNVHTVSQQPRIRSGRETISFKKGCVPKEIDPFGKQSSSGFFDDPGLSRSPLLPPRLLSFYSSKLGRQSNMGFLCCWTHPELKNNSFTIKLNSFKFEKKE